MALSFKPLGNILHAIASPFEAAGRDIGSLFSDNDAPAAQAKPPPNRATAPPQGSPTNPALFGNQPQAAQQHPNLPFLLTPPPGQKKDNFGNILPPNSPSGNKVLDPFGSLASGAIRSTAKIAGIGVEDTRVIAGMIGNNPAATQAALQRGGRDIGTLGQAFQSIPRAAVTLARSIPFPGVSPFSAPVQPSGAGAVILGKQPVSSLEQSYQAGRANGGGVVGGLSTATAQGIGNVAALVTLGKPITKGVAILKGAKTSDIPQSVDNPIPPSNKLTFKNPTTTEADVARVHQSNPLNPPETNSSEPLPTPPAGVNVPTSGIPSVEELKSLYESKPQGEKPSTSGAPDVPSGSEKIAPPALNPVGEPNLPAARPGDFQQFGINKALFDQHIDETATDTIDKVNQLTPADRANFIHFVQGVLPLTKAKEPGAVGEAVASWRQLADSTYATDTYSGGKTSYKQNYFPGYFVDKETGELKTTGTDNFHGPTDPHGFRSQQAKYPNRKAALDNGEIPLNEDPVQDIIRYAQGAKYQVGSNLTKKAIEEADKNNPGSKSNVTLKDGTTVNVSKKGEKALSGDMKRPSNKVTAVLKGINRGAKQILISTGVPHAVIIPQRFAGALATLKLPPLHDLGDAATPIEASDRELAIRLNSPIHGEKINAGISSTSKGAKYNPFTAPKRVVYNWLLPKMHITLIRAAKSYMEARGIHPDSAEARDIGRQINDVMGYANNKGGAFNESVFAPALIRSTAHMYGRAALPGGAIARGGVLGQQVFNEGLGFLSKAYSNQVSQNQGNPQNESKDDFLSTFFKEIYNPSLYTPYYNAKGEQVDLHIPGQYQSDAAKVVLSLNRNKSGQLQPRFNTPSEVASNTAQTAKNIASPVVGAAVSAISNQAYNGNQIRNPYDPLPEQAAQTALHEASNVLPINLQGLVNNKLESRLPGFLKSSIEVNKNAGPEVLRLGGNTLGLNPTADQTTGQGPATKTYFAGQTQGRDYIAAHSNNITTQNDLEGKFTDYFSRQKNDKGQTVQEDGATRLANAKMLQGNPTLYKAVQVAEKANGKGNYDPMWDLSDDQLKTFLHYQATPTGYPERNHILNQNSWLGNFIQTRSQYFDSLTQKGNSVPAPNTPQFPQFDAATQSKLDSITKLESIPSTQRTADQVNQLAAYYNDPKVTDAQQAKYAYNNAMQQAEGVSQLQYPAPQDAALGSAYAAYQNLPKGNGKKGGSPDRAAWIKANPDTWNAIQNMLATQTQSIIDRQGAIAEFKGEQPSNSLLGAEYSAGQYDITKTRQDNGTNVYAINPAGAYTANSSGGSGSSSTSQAFSKYVAETKAAARARAAEKSVKALKYGQVKNYSRPQKTKVKIKGNPQLSRNTIQLPGVTRHFTPKVKAKAAPSGNKVKLRV